ncbi:carcinoembryonic antigen-related cell adhesion molecule 1-like isoform X3 [Neofelis nebulosa]|uniref:carcinoembryonic antigen-related cell adhesion molecule 1-like isoform X3 n=1 Tax=Neofelis nebulosa TaxID=61452 RepID=UPI00272BE743|nr:carcinoembryonic antigen-related cell adhesion molecule 1-like isoform X3 [Neofelis nebulosa]
MEPPSALPRGGRVPWQELLLAVSLLTFWNPPTTAQATIELVPPNAAEGKDVLLRVHNLPANLLGFGWFKGTTIDPHREIVSYAADSQEITPGLAHSGRETLYHNGSLLFQNISLEDTGYYTLQIIKRNVQVERVTGQLRVYHGPDAPTISPSDSYYLPGANLSLSCHSASNPPAQYSWLINGSPQPSSQELFIPNITVNDSGSYTCLVYNPGTRLSKTTVKTITVSEPVSQPSINISNTTATEHKDSVVLTCSTNNTGVSIWWFFNNQSLKLTERMKLSPDNSTLTVDPVRREDAGDYQCEVSNPVSSSKSDLVKLNVEYDFTQQSSGLSAGAIAGIVIGVLAGVALIAALLYFLCNRKSGGTSDLRDLTEHKPSASNHSQDHSDNVHNKTDEVAYSSLNFNVQAPKKSASASPSLTATETVYSEVQKK